MPRNKILFAMLSYPRPQLSRRHIVSRSHTAFRWRNDTKGCRPLTKKEISSVAGLLEGEQVSRNKVLFALGAKSDFRVSDVLSLRIRDVFQHSRIVDRITVRHSRSTKMLSSTWPWPSMLIRIPHDSSRPVKALPVSCDRVFRFGESAFPTSFTPTRWCEGLVVGLPVFGSGGHERRHAPVTPVAVASSLGACPDPLTARQQRVLIGRYVNVGLRILEVGIVIQL